MFFYSKASKNTNSLPQQHEHQPCQSQQHEQIIIIEQEQTDQQQNNKQITLQKSVHKSCTCSIGRCLTCVCAREKRRCTSLCHKSENTNCANLKN